MKIRHVILLVLVAAVVYYYRADIAAYWTGLEQKYPDLQPAVALQNIKQLTDSLTVASTSVPSAERQVMAPSPLRLANPFRSTTVLTRAGVIELTNAERQKDGQPLLKENKLLDAAAEKKAADMFAKQYFAHISPSGRGPGEVVVAAGYEYLAVGENLAEGNFENNTALVAAWMASPGHRANILNDHFTEIGVAVVQGTFEGQRTWMAVQEFGRPAADCPLPDPALRQKLEAQDAELKDLKGQLSAKRVELNSADQSSQGYVTLVAQYNYLVSQYNALADQEQTDVTAYNALVVQYNNCLKL